MMKMVKYRDGAACNSPSRDTGKWSFPMPNQYTQLPREIPLSQGKVALVDEGDYDALMAFKWYAHRHGRTFYARRNYVVDGEWHYALMHRAIMQADDEQRIDHRDGDGLNNQRTNLRFATLTQNSANRTRLYTNKSGRRGVSWKRQYGRWQATITSGEKQTHLGYFDDLDEAARAYDTAAHRIFGEFARPNFGDDQA